MDEYVTGELAGWRFDDDGRTPVMLYTSSGERIVRCRDCDLCNVNKNGDHVCGLHSSVGYFKVNPNGFCWLGIRRKR